MLYTALFLDAEPYVAAVHADEEVENAAYTANSESLVEKQQRIASYGFLQESSCGSDIGEHLNLRLAWSPDYLAVPWRKEQDEEQEMLPLIAKKVRQMRMMRYRGKDFFWSSSMDFSDPDDLESFLEKAGLDALDSAWMDTLADGSSCWDISSNSPRAAYFPLDPLELPEPDYAEFSAWATVRLLHGMRDGDAGRALRTTRAWATLLFSTQRLAGADAGHLLLMQEAIAWERMRRSGMEVGDWTPVPYEDQEAIFQAVHGAVAFYNLWTPRDSLPLTEKLPVGRCIALAEGISFGSRFLGSTLREGKESQIENIQRWLDHEESHCRLHLMRKYWDISPDTASSGPAFEVTPGDFCDRARERGLAQRNCAFAEWTGSIPHFVRDAAERDMQLITRSDFRGVFETTD
jgi:hypothetical protein